MQKNNAELDKSQKIIKLFNDDIFKEIIMQDFINKGIIDFTLDMNLDNERTIDELKARQILNSWLMSLIILDDDS